MVGLSLGLGLGRRSFVPPGLTKRVGIPLIGVNVSGAEHSTSVEPGTYVTDYQYPAPEDVDYWIDKGCTCIRVPFRWKRIQPVLNGDLDATELGRLKALTNHITGRGVSVVLDLHNYGAFEAGTVYVGSAGLPNSAYVDLWTRLAPEFASNPKVIWGLMNEPKPTDWPAWLGAQNEVIAAIRAAGATQLILVSGAEGGTLATTLAAKDQWALVTDSGNNWAIEVHRYLDSAANGTQATVVHTWRMLEPLPAITSWAKQKGYRLFYGEVGGGNNTDAATAIRRGLGYIQNHPSVWIGVTLWGGGKRLGSGNPLYLEPASGVDKLIAQELFTFVPDGSRAAIRQTVDVQPGTPDANIAYAAGKFGSGRSAGIITGHAYSTYKIDAVTIEAWVRCDGAGTINNAAGASGVAAIGVAANGTARATYGGGANAITFTTPTNLLDSAWHHLSISAGEGGGKFFVDGIQVGTNARTYRTALSTAAVGQFAMYIGAHLTGGTVWNGIVDEVASFAAAIRTANFTPPAQPYTGNEDHLLGVWRLNGDATGLVSAA